MTQSTTLELQADFIKDYLDYSRLVMTHEGYDISTISDDEILMYFFCAILKRPAVKTRTLYESDVFSCPEPLKEGWKKLSSKVTNGEDFSLHLSRKISDISSHDSLLNEWGVYHLHLGESIDPKTGFIDRTGPLLFALVNQDSFYAINVYAHGQWTEPDIVEVIKRNWPETIEHAKINGISVKNNPSPKDRIALRKANVNHPITTADGTMYGSIGGGSATSGMSIRAVIWSGRQRMTLSEAQRLTQEGLPEFVKTFKGYSGEQKINATLVITENGPKVFFPQFNEFVDVKVPTK